MPRRKKLKTKTVEAKRHHLSRIQTARLYMWLNKRKRLAKATESSALAAIAATELGFSISMPQMRDMKKDMGLIGPRGRKERNGADSGSLRMLARELIEVREHCSLPISAELQALAK